MLLRWQKLLDISTHILNLILWMTYFRAKFSVLWSKAWTFVHSVQWWFGKDKCFCFSVKCRTCPFLKRLRSVKWIKRHQKNAPHRGREPKEETASDNCRLCSCFFKTKFGNFKTGWITTENIFTAPQRKGKTLPMLAKVFRANLSLHVEEENSLSSRVCSPRGTKVRNCATMLSQSKKN